MAQSVKSLPAMRMTWVWSLSWEALLEKEMATHSSIPVWRTPMDRGAWWATQFMGSQSVGWDSRTNLHFSLSSYFELSNYSFSRNCFTLAKTNKKKSQSANQSFQRKFISEEGTSRCLSCSTEIPVRRCKLHLTYGGQPPPTLQSATRQGSSRGATNCWLVSVTAQRTASDAGTEGYTCTHLGNTSQGMLQVTAMCWATATADKELRINPR